MKKLSHSKFLSLLDLASQINDEQKIDLQKFMTLDLDGRNLLLKYSKISFDVKNISTTRNIRFSPVDLAIKPISDDNINNTLQTTEAVKVVLISPVRQASLDINAEYKDLHKSGKFLPFEIIRTKETTLLNRELGLHTINQNQINMTRRKK